MKNEGMEVVETKEAYEALQPIEEPDYPAAICNCEDDEESTPLEKGLTVGLYTAAAAGIILGGMKIYDFVKGKISGDEEDEEEDEQPKKKGKKSKKSKKDKKKLFGKKKKSKKQHEDDESEEEAIDADFREVEEEIEEGEDEE